MSATKRLASALAIGYLLLASVCFAMAVFSYPQREILPSFYWNWIATHSFELFARFLVPVHLAALAVAVSVRSPKAGSSTFAPAVQGPLVVLIVVTVLYTATVEYFLPAASSGEKRMTAVTTVFRNAYDEGEAAFKAGRYDEALSRVGVCLGIEPGHEAARDLQDRIIQKRSTTSPVPDVAATGRPVKTPAAAAPVQPEVPETGERSLTTSAGGLSALEYFRMAQGYFGRGDFYSAHLYATRAADIDPGRADARRLAAQAWARIEGSVPRGESPEHTLFARKKDGYTALVSNDPLTAYYIFTDLKRTNPKDPDVVRYYGMSLAAVKRISFFTDEFSLFDAVPGNTGLLFRNGNRGGEVELVSVGKEAAVGADEYFRNIEVVRFDSSGVKLHFSAPYGKRVKDELLLLAVDRRNPSVFFKPQFYEGGASGPAMLRLEFRPDEFDLLAKSRLPLDGSNIGELVAMRPVMERAGFDSGVVRQEILFRIFQPIEFLFLSALVLIAGIRLRSPRAVRPPVFQLLFGSALFTVIAWWLASAWSGLNRSLIATLAASGNFLSAEIVFFAIQACFIVLVVIMLAGQRPES